MTSQAAIAALDLMRPRVGFDPWSIVSPMAGFYAPNIRGVANGAALASVANIIPGNDFVQANVSNRPTYASAGINGLPAVAFNRLAPHYFLVNRPAGVWETRFKMIAVVQYAALGNAEVWCGRGNGDTRGIGKNAANQHRAAMAGTELTFGPVLANTPYVIRSRFLPEADVSLFWVNGVFAGVGDTGNGSFESTFAIGTGYSAGVTNSRFGGWMSMWALYDPICLDDHLEEVEAGLIDLFVP